MSTSLLYRLLLTGLCLLFAFPDFGQPYYNQSSQFLKANSIWATLGGSALNFNTSPPGLIPIPGAGGGEGVASVADPVTGAYLFFSNGETVWNAGNQIMLNGDSLLGNSTGSGAMGFGMGWMGGSSTQGVCIVPFIDQPGKYYLFSLCGPTNWPPPSVTAYLYYSVIDMSLDGGLGGIVPGQKNIPLGGNTPLSESMIAVPGDNCDIWLMVHDHINPVFKAFHITRDGLDPNPVVSTAGTQLQGNGALGAYFMGSMAISPDRKTIGITSSIANLYIPGITGVVLCKFDPATGTAGASVLMEPLIRVYSLAFSPDNTKLYVLPADTSYLNLRQYDISIFDSTAIATSRIKVGHVAGSPEIILKSYDGKIYVPNDDTDSLFVIDQPNLPGLACSYQYAAGVQITNGLSLHSRLPSDVVYPLPPDTAAHRRDTTVCTRNQIFPDVELRAQAGYYGYTWNDGSTAAVHTITAPGTYWVLCKDSCHSLIDTFIVTTKDIPLSLGPDTTLCTQATLRLDAMIPGGSYLWQDNSTKNNFSVTDSGTYWVQVIAAGCTVSDTIAIRTEDLSQDLGPDIVHCNGDELRLITLQANVPQGATAQWNTGSQAATVTVADTGSYWVTVTSAACIGTDTIYAIPEICECQLALPNAFTPNNDGLNDKFLPAIETGCSVSGYVLSIYNRFGQRVYAGFNADKGWDGFYNGLPAETATYMYELTFTGGTKQVKHYRKGDLVLIR